ncbi:hypothetical protein CEXT_267081 [Caerostris extrusa]|uniref:Uncharacterized protein n=1 Tax=Caerostris extrusa TaxID=172846 RepID=A0AAV4U3N6_CAEEX|nr:hypothetical protein CEXT_267081 [Caerostris extrusa]
MKRIIATAIRTVTLKSKVTRDPFTRLSERSPPQTSITPSENLWHDPYHPLLERPDRRCPFSNAVVRRTPAFHPTPKKILLAVDDYWPSANEETSGPPQEDGEQSSFFEANAPGKVFFGASPSQTSITPSENLWHDPYHPLSNVPIEDVPFRTLWFDEPYYPPQEILLAVDDYWPSANQDVRPPQEEGEQFSFFGANAPGKVFFGALSLLSLEGIDKWDYWEGGREACLEALGASGIKKMGIRDMREEDKKKAVKIG